MYGLQRTSQNGFQNDSKRDSLKLHDVDLSSDEAYFNAAFDCIAVGQSRRNETVFDTD